LISPLRGDGGLEARPTEAAGGRAAGSGAIRSPFANDQDPHLQGFSMPTAQIFARRDGATTPIRLVVMLVAAAALGLTLWASPAGWAQTSAPAAASETAAPTPTPAPEAAPAEAAPLRPAAATGSPAAAAGDPVAAGGMTNLYKLREMFMFSPVINGIIAGLSVLALMLFLWFLLTINVRAVAPAGFVNEVTNLVLAHRYDAAADACRRSKRVFIAPVVLRSVTNAGKSQSIIMSMIDAEGRRLSDIIWNRISYLADISNVAPMLGLLGTVMGMITAFFGLDKESGSINSSVLSQGVGQAMTTTMFGLIVGISALVFYSIIKSRATKCLAEAEAAVHSIADRIRNAEDDDSYDDDEPRGRAMSKLL